jgi:hypothetical protein
MNTNKRMKSMFITHQLQDKFTIKSQILILFVIIFAFIFTAQVFSILTYEVTIRNSGVIATISHLHVEGRYIKNAYGQIVLLRGINKAGFEDSQHGWWNPEGGGINTGAGVWNLTNVRYNLQKIREWGSNVVRFHYSIDFWVRQDLYPYFRQHVKEVTEICADLGMYVIWDPYSIVVGGSHPKFPWPPYLSNETGNRGYSELDIIPSRDAFIEHCREFADWLKDYPNVLFEHYSEPGVSIDPYWGWYPDKPDWQDWVNVTQHCINAIRSTGAKQPIIVTGHVDVWCNLDAGDIGLGSTMYWVTQVISGGATPIVDPLNNIIYCTHQYRASDGLGLHNNYSKGWTYSEVYDAMRYTKILHVIENLSLPLIITECGPLMWHRGDEFIREMEGWANQLRIYNQLGISYVAWVWTVPSHMPGGLLTLTNGRWYCEPNAGGRILQYYLKAPIFLDTSLYEHPILEYDAEWWNQIYRITEKPYVSTYATEAPTRVLLRTITFDESLETLTLNLSTLMPGSTQMIEVMCRIYGEPTSIVNATKVSFDSAKSKLKIKFTFAETDIIVVIKWAT